MNSFIVITKSELDDFYRSIKDSGYEQSDFDIYETNLTNYAEVPNYIPKGEIKVTRISTKKYKTYTTGTGSVWVASFDEDLNKKLYGPP